MAILGFELEDIAKLLALVDEHGLEEILLEEGEQTLRIRGATYSRKAPKSTAVTVVESTPNVTPTRPPVAQIAAASRTVQSSKASAPAEDTAGLIALKSPMVGVFYRSNQPGAPPLIDIGQPVAVGQAIGIIEAMKIFSEIPAELAGVVVSIPAKEGKLVQAGETLVLLRAG